MAAERRRRAARWMNPYGDRALSYVRDFCPLRYATIDDPAGFFADLGDQMHTIVETAVDALIRAPGPPDASTPEGWLERVGRINMSKLMLEEKVFWDMVYAEFPAEEDPDDEAEEAAWESLLPSNEEWFRDEQADYETTFDAEGRQVDPFP